MTSTDKERAVVLLSGGLDSSTVLSIAVFGGYDVYALSFDYNQRHRLELKSAGLVASSMPVKKHLVVGFDLREIGGSALTADIDVPKNGIGSSIPSTYVPARNTIFLSFALGWAEVLGASSIFIGANAIDYSGYPDCRPEYLEAFEKTANLATRASVEGSIKYKIKAPLLHMKKKDIIRKGSELGLDYSKTWSCYDPQHIKQPAGAAEDFRFHYKPCGLCDSCRLRRKGFEEAGLKDPLQEFYSIN